MDGSEENVELFSFYTRLTLTELTGLRALNINQLAELIRVVPDSSVYHHTHRFLQQHQYLSPEPPNDFAYWVSEILGEKALGERLASIDLVQFTSISSLREEILKTIESFIEETSQTGFKSVRKEDAFYFMRSHSFILPTGYVAGNLKEFADILGEISIDSIYFHVFEARLRLGKKTDDFSLWIADSLGNKKLADAISRLDPYTYTLDGLRQTIIDMVKKQIK